MPPRFERFIRAERLAGLRADHGGFVTVADESHNTAATKKAQLVECETRSVVPEENHLAGRTKLAIQSPEQVQQ